MEESPNVPSQEPEKSDGSAEALRHSQARFAGIVRLSEDAIISVDEQQQIILFNESAERIFGYRTEEVLGKALDLLIPERFRFTHREHLTNFSGSGDAMRTMNERGEIYGIRKDGTEFPAQASISKFEVGRERVLTVRLRDITEVRRAAGALRKSEATVGALLESASQGVVAIDQNGYIMLVNAKTEQLFGYSREELIGLPLETLLPERLRGLHIAHRNGYFEQPRGRPMGLGLDLAARRKDGTEFPVEISLSHMQAEDGTIALSFITDITERKRIDEQLRRSLAEKDVLLREIHHRVKNNLQVISSLLSLQSGMTKDPVVSEILRDSKDRVNAMALVHEKLFQSDDLAAINFADYIRTLAKGLFHSYVSEMKPIQINTNVTVAPGVDQAIPCGLIVNELLSNSMKHAFPGDRIGEINLTMHSEGELCILRVTDDGIGLPPESEIAKKETLGLKLVDALAAQLGATIERRGGNGTVFELRFRLERREP